MSQANDDAYFELSFSPNARLVAIVRRFVSEFYARVLHDPEVTSRLAVATHELLENAIRYSTDGNTTVRVAIRREAEGPVVSINTLNRTAADNAATVERAVDELATGDPQAHYQALMRRSMNRVDGLGLGLGRVSAECGMRLSCTVEDQVVEVRAEARFEGEQGEVTAFKVDDLETEELRVAVAVPEPAAVHVRLVGTAESEAMPALDALLRRVHDEAVRTNVREVIVDLRELEFMNSSCFKAFVSWVGRVEELDLARQYQIRFLSDPGKHWQARSLGALTCFATHIIQVESGK